MSPFSEVLEAAQGCPLIGCCGNHFCTTAALGARQLGIGLPINVLSLLMSAESKIHSLLPDELFKKSCTVRWLMQGERGLVMQEAFEDLTLQAEH